MTDYSIDRGVVFIFFDEVTIGETDYLTGLSWVIEDVEKGQTVGHHYFIDYPGARELERSISEVVGGNPLTRYTPKTVMTALVGDVPSRSIVLFRNLDDRRQFRKYAEANGVKIPSPAATLKDIMFTEEELDGIYDFVDELKLRAATEFGVHDE